MANYHIMPKNMIITLNFPIENLKARMAWTHVIQTLINYRYHPRLLYPEEFSINIDGETMTMESGIKWILEGKHQHN